MAHKEYTNGEVTVTWEPDKCIHAGICFKGLPDVFKPKEKPWVKIEAAESNEIVNQVKKCPSGALGYYLKAEEEEEDLINNSLQQVQVINNGPLMIHGDIEVEFPDGNKIKMEKRTAFCRCGASANKPYCDGSHKKINFQS